MAVVQTRKYHEVLDVSLASYHLIPKPLELNFHLESKTMETRTEIKINNKCSKNEFSPKTKL